MRRLWLVPTRETTHEDVFLRRYDRLLTQALHITERRHSAAEDLVHDAFIQFTLSKPDLSSINDLDSYLFIVLRNMHLSQMRRASQSRFAPISIADYDSAAIGLRAIDIQHHLQIADELLRICHYVCSRKETSKAASVLILRFFHGYFTGEIAEVINAPRRTIHEWLRLARNEVKEYLDDPGKAATENERLSTRPNGNDSDLLGLLRERIFASRQGACLSAKQVEQLYANENSIECKTLAHIVSCPHCLDGVNKTRKLPPFSERYPTDVLGSDRRSNSGGNEMNRVTRAGVSSDYLKLCRRRLGEVLDHQPQALSFSANGFILGSQTINGDTTEQILSINIDEQVSFVEVFSEQGIRLMLMGVVPSAIGGVEQKSRIELGKSRELECAINFRQPWPTLHVTYRNQPSRVANLALVGSADHEEPRPIEVTTTEQRGPSFWSRLFRSDFWLRPEFVTVLVVCCLVAALAFWFTRSTPQTVPLSTASELLQNAVAKEDAANAQSGTVIHRTINLEEATATGAVIGRKRIEVWQNIDRGIMVRRLYNDRGELLGGDWRRADGVQTLYQHGVDPRIQLAPEKRDELPLSFEQIWQLSTSAKEFKRLAANENLRVEDQTDTLKLSYEPSKSTGDPRIIRASMTLNRSDWHVRSQTLLVQQGKDVRSFHFVETSVQKHSADQVPAGIFELDSLLLPEKKKDTNVTTQKEEAEAAATKEPAPPVATATAELEIEVLGILNRIEADSGEQIVVRRIPSGVLQVEGVAELAERKQQILQALAPVIGNPALRVNIETVEERVAREASAKTTPDTISLERIEVTSNSIPLESELRSYFSSRGVSPNQLDGEVQRFSRSALGHSSKLLQHAGALMSLTGRFSVEELRELDPDARRKWLDLVRGHAQGLRQNAVLLQRELGQVLGQSRTDVLAEPSVESDAILIQTVNRLFTTVSSIDQTVRANMSLSNNPGSTTKIKAVQFWRSLSVAEDLAIKIASSK